jgi:hypothetical protein
LGISVQGSGALAAACGTAVGQGALDDGLSS